jgi:hypothetical protein
MDSLPNNPIMITGLIADQVRTRLRNFQIGTVRRDDAACAAVADGGSARRRPTSHWQTSNYRMDIAAK